MYVCPSVCLCIYHTLFKMFLSLVPNHYIQHIRVDVLHTIPRWKGQRSSSHIISIEILVLANCFRGRSLDTIEIHLQHAVNSIHEWAAMNGLKFADHKCKVIHFTAPWSNVQGLHVVRIADTFLPVEEPTKFLGLWVDLPLSFKKHAIVLKTQCKEALNLRGQRHTLDVVQSYFSVQAGLWFHCVWHIIEHQFMTTR